nr:YcfL family protein [Vibrio sp. HA2012]
MKKSLACCLSAVFFMAGCTSITAGLRVDSQTQKVVFADRVLGNRLEVGDIAIIESEGHSRGIVTLSSQYGSDQHIQYRFYWYDDDGLEVNSKQAAWKGAVVHGYDVISVSEVSVNPRGTQFRVQIRQIDE